MPHFLLTEAHHSLFLLAGGQWLSLLLLIKILFCLSNYFLSQIIWIKLNSKQLFSTCNWPQAQQLYFWAAKEWCAQKLIFQPPFTRPQPRTIKDTISLCKSYIAKKRRLIIWQWRDCSYCTSLKSATQISDVQEGRIISSFLSIKNQKPLLTFPKIHLIFAVEELRLSTWKSGSLLAGLEKLDN